MRFSSPATETTALTTADRSSEASILDCAGIGAEIVSILVTPVEAETVTLLKKKVDQT